MKVYSTSYFKVYHKDFEGNWDYLISETPLEMGAIEGLLNLNYQERIQVLEILERGDGIQAINVGDKTYGFEYVGEMETSSRKYRLLSAKFEDISTTEIATIEKPKRNNKKLNFKED